MRYLVIPIAALAIAYGAQRSEESATGAAGPSHGATAAAAKPRTIASGLSFPWEVAFLPGGKALVTERGSGRLYAIARPGARPKPIRSIPGVNHDSGEGGLLGLAVSPTYRRDKLIYAYLTTRSDNRIVRFRLHGRPRVVVKGLRRGEIHNGGRIKFGPDGKLYAGVGETGETALAQSRRTLNGKILRMNPDGSVPKSNPFEGSRIWTLGHRNVQGLAWDRRGRLWASELGQDRFDELNLIRKGRNYGWPLVEGRGKRKGFVDPKMTWRTSQASPSGVAIKGDYLYMAALRGEGIWKVRLKGARTGKRTKLFSGRFGRIRTVVKAPSGRLWFTTSNGDGDRIVSFGG